MPPRSVGEATLRIQRVALSTVSRWFVEVRGSTQPTQKPQKTPQVWGDSQPGSCRNFSLQVFLSITGFQYYEHQHGAPHGSGVTVAERGGHINSSGGCPGATMVFAAHRAIVGKPAKVRAFGRLGKKCGFGDMNGRTNRWSYIYVKKNVLSSYKNIYIYIYISFLGSDLYSTRFFSVW